jgi:cholest-4-en-3-one 26-monooxygenase
MAPEIDLVDPDSYARHGAPHDQLSWMRAHSPVFWHAAGGGEGWPGFWAITRHRDVEQVSRSPQIFSSYQRLALFEELPADVVDRQRLMTINMDPPQHTRQRSFVNRMFTPRIISQLRERIGEICAGLLDDVIPLGAADFVADIAAPLPLYVLCELLGAPPEDRGHLIRIASRLVGNDDPGDRSAAGNGRGATRQDAATPLSLSSADLAAQRRAAPRDDIVTRLLAPDEHGESLTTNEFYMFVLMLTIAGTETTTFAAAGGMQAFFTHPAQWRRLLDNPGLIATAVDEIVRWTSPVNLFRRTATCDTEVGGQPIAQGDKVVVFYSSANRDADVFADPFAFDIGRDPNPHAGFGGGGPHFCLGRQLAQLELQVLFAALAGRAPGIGPDGPAVRLRSSFLNGIKQLPVRFG